VGGREERGERGGGRGKKEKGWGEGQGEGGEGEETITVTLGFVMVEMERATGGEETRDCIQGEHEREEKKKKGQRGGRKGKEWGWRLRVKQPFIGSQVSQLTGIRPPNDDFPPSRHKTCAG